MTDAVARIHRKQTREAARVETRAKTARFLARTVGAVVAYLEPKTRYVPVGAVVRRGTPTDRDVLFDLSQIYLFEREFKKLTAMGICPDRFGS